MSLAAPRPNSSAPELASDAPPQAVPRASVRIAWPHVVLGLLGIGISLYSVKLHNIVKAGGSACDISETISCDKVLGSVWAAPLGVPVGLFGVLFFGLVILTAISTAPKATERSLARVRLLLSVPGLLGALALLFISKVLIGAWCPVCLATHSIVLFNFLAAAWAWKKAR